ncbi:Rubrerythrin [Desulfofarcimen acetoxidans DSM 771]|jgi:rubrerythrin|uniref:Rubrerythrin n=1 Tax=Desulfofarcimen acetoxidans (strain ATCC 49208 / DSM 771 / KCTC 5769 / VKM B-1644 / 5575) TaxID=485916 RepID=C8W1M4_DESAS|nr:rubrerythrin family protein [Desulfofarcimen acetoxidans]ACV63495.1 Rubrerythrin [Desulfofarcimen acetoxidans DSM 771]
MSIKGTQTEKNLLMAFAGESQARNRYTYFAAKAKKEGYEQISAIFLETAEHEKEHAKRFFKFLEGGDLEITAAFPAGIISDTAANLRSAASGENHEYSHLYPEFAKVAEEEGFPIIAAVFRAVMVAETYHEKRFLSLLANIEQDKVFKREQAVIWKCRNCGNLHEGTEAPDSCPACAHPKSFFEIKADNY